jgi:Alginate export
MKVLFEGTHSPQSGFIIRAVAMSIMLLGVALDLRAQESSPTDTQGEQEARPTGLPDAGEWTFNINAGLGAFAFSNSLYANPRPDPSGDLSSNWQESYVKPALSGDFKLHNGSTVFAKGSVVGARTFSAPPSIVGESASGYHAEDLYIGWRSGTSLDLGEDAIELTLGRAPYKLGHGFLIYDGSGDGGSRGGFWTGARSAWERAAIGRFKVKNHTLETFYLERDDLPEAETDTKLWGVNYELAVGENSTLGLTYIKASADENTQPLRDGMDVYDARAFLAPFSSLPGLLFELEYALEDNGDAMESTGWTAQLGYQLSEVTWKPRLSYRYTSFEGDDPNTPESEAFDALYLGFYDWGAWYQGEIAGEYFLANSNLTSHQVRLHVTPSESLSGGLIAYDFLLDQPETFAPGVTSDDVAYELDAYVDWKINSNITASFVFAYAEPGDAVEEGLGRTESLKYGMVYVSYAY